MKEFDINRLKTSLIYAKRMADGKNPATNASTHNDLLENPNVIRFFHFVEEVLEEVIDNHGVVGAKYVRPKEPFPFAELDTYVYRHDKPLSHVIKQMLEPFEDRNIRRPNAAAINKWLRQNDYLDKKTPEGSAKEEWSPTEKGLAAGIYMEKRGLPGEEYISILYNERGQQFLVDHLERSLTDIEAQKQNA